MSPAPPLDLSRLALSLGRLTHRTIMRAAASDDISPDTCFMWPHATTDRGYPPVGVLHPDTGKWTSVSGHRWVLFLAAGPPPDPSYQAAHDPVVCQGPPCINRFHLRWATALDNMADQLVVGTRHLTDEDVERIILDPRPQLEIAAQYRITQAYVSMLKSGKAQRQAAQREVMHILPYASLGPSDQGNPVVHHEEQLSLLLRWGGKTVFPGQGDAGEEATAGCQQGRMMAFPLVGAHDDAESFALSAVGSPGGSNEPIRGLNGTLDERTTGGRP